jgi:hypothetical protein
VGYKGHGSTLLGFESTECEVWGGGRRHTLMVQHLGWEKRVPLLIGDGDVYH